ncbi:MAG TPA: hypothetical protein ENG66_00785 [Thermococcus sp.]|nr:hypothetical protein [Thermococcus sp.]
MAKKEKRRKKHSSISDHFRKGTKLVPQLAQLGSKIEFIQWDRDLVPEHLWIAALSEKYGVDNAHKPFNDLLDALDDVWPHKDTPPLGFITDFGEVPTDAREFFCREHKKLIEATFLVPIGRILAFYPDSPASWLIDSGYLELGGSLDPEIELSKLRKLITTLLPGKDELAGRLRVLPFIRLLKHRKVFFPRGMEIVEAMPRYPHNCTEEEKRQIESFCRTIVNMHYQMAKHYKTKKWPKYFWRHNYEIVPCRPIMLPIQGSRPVTEEEVPQLTSALEANVKAAKAYIQLLQNRVPCDLYEPVKDEILFGLISRAIRLFILLMSDPNLWARDVAGIMLRCLADTAITFVYLAKCGTKADFDDFRAYGEGQEKLLMLHLQDNYPEAKSLEGRTAEAISEGLGGFNVELINIELGSWAKKNTRKLAQEAGLENCIVWYLVQLVQTSTEHG